MSKHTLTHGVVDRLVQVFLILLIGTMSALSQDVRIESKKTSQLSLPENAIQRLVIQSADKTQIGNILRNKDTLLVSLPGRKIVKLPYRLQPVVSFDGSTIIQYGDKMLMDLPKHLDVYWIDNDGKEKAGLVNRYSGDARLDVSSDGYTAVGGILLDKPREATISLFSPDGNKIWETGVAKNRRVAQLFAAKLGRIVAAVTTDAEKKLEKFQLDIYGKSGSIQSVVKDLGIIQKVVLLGDDTKLFFQGREFHGMIDVASGRVIWKNQGKVTLVSPYGASLSPDGKKLFLMVVQPEGKRTGVYQWKFMVLDPSNGKEIGSQLLPDTYPATWERIFESVGDDTVSVLAGDSRITITVGSEKGGRK
jgi:hypothetical protein